MNIPVTGKRAWPESLWLRYEILVCPECRAQITPLPDDGEGMYPRGWCKGPERHLVLDRNALRLRVVEVA